MHLDLPVFIYTAKLHFPWLFSGSHVDAYTENFFKLSQYIFWKIVKFTTLTKERGGVFLLSKRPHSLPLSVLLFTYKEGFFQGVVEGLFISLWILICSWSSVTLLIAEAWVVWVQFSSVTVFSWVIFGKLFKTSTPLPSPKSVTLRTCIKMEASF